MTTEQAIKKAIEGGWKQPTPCLFDGIEVYHKGNAFLDSLFWKSFGIGMGAGKSYTFKQSVPAIFGPKRKDGTRATYPAEIRMQRRLAANPWKKNGHRFIDCLADQGSADEFFAALDASTHAAPPTKSQAES